MSSHGPTLVFTCLESIWWVRDARQIIVINDQSGQTYRIGGLDAAIWNWLTLSYSYAKVVQMVAIAHTVSIEKAKKILTTTLQKWYQADLLVVSEEPKCG